MEIAKLYMEDGHINVKFRRYEQKNVGASTKVLIITMLQITKGPKEVRFIHSAV